LLSAAPLLLGLDGQKMSKSRGNAIALRDDEDRTAALLRQARTDSERQITYEPGRRPEVTNLLRSPRCAPTACPSRSLRMSVTAAQAH